MFAANVDLHTAFGFPVTRIWRLSCSFTEGWAFSPSFLKESTIVLKGRKFLMLCVSGMSKMSEALSLLVGLVWSVKLNGAALLCSSCSYRAWWFPSCVAPKHISTIWCQTSLRWFLLYLLWGQSFSRFSENCVWALLWIDTMLFGGQTGHARMSSPLNDKPELHSAVC